MAGFMLASLLQKSLDRRDAPNRLKALRLTGKLELFSSKSSPIPPSGGISFHSDHSLRHVQNACRRYGDNARPSGKHNHRPVDRGPSIVVPLIPAQFFLAGVAAVTVIVTKLPIAIR